MATHSIQGTVIGDTLEGWRDEAACAAPGTGIDFFPEPDDVGGIALAKSVCAVCPVSDDCLSFAVEARQEEGIWGGTTPAERKRIRRIWLREMRKAS